MFDVLVDELRTHSTEWLESRRCEVIGVQRELHAEELAIVRVLVDDDGAVVAIGRATPGLSPKVRRAVLVRDTRCRVPGCGQRRGLEVHHLRITDCWYRTGCSRSSGTRTCPMGSNSSPRAAALRWCGVTRCR